MKYFAFTIRVLTHVPTATEYDRIVAKIKEKFTHLDIRYHLEIKYKMNGHHNVHMHGMMRTNKSLSYRKLRSLLGKGIHLWIETVYSKLGWNSYITKKNQTEVRDAIVRIHLNQLDSTTSGVKFGKIIKMA